MSATNRGAVRNERDFYATPLSAFTPLIKYLPKNPTVIWEPACGDGRLVSAMNDCGRLASPPIHPYVSIGSDIEPQGEGVRADFLEFDSPLEGAQCILTNPPFSLAMEFCAKAVALVPEVFMLLRLPFLASASRRAWFQKNEPSALFVLSKRPSFTDDGKTDATDYAWFYWGKRHSGIFHL